MRGMWFPNFSQERAECPRCGSIDIRMIVGLRRRAGFWPRLLLGGAFPRIEAFIEEVRCGGWRNCGWVGTYSVWADGRHEPLKWKRLKLK